MLSVVQENYFNFSLPQELNLYYCGKRIHTLNHFYGPYIKNHLLINYVTEGKAEIHCEANVFHAAAGQIFVMFPNSRIQYRCEEGTYWSIKWVGIYGELAYRYLENLGINHLNPVYTVPDGKKISEILDRIFELSISESYSDKIRCVSLLHEYFSALSAGVDYGNSTNHYIADAQNFIQHNYDRKIRISEIADAVNLDTNYFSKLYKKETGISPSEKITDLKVKRACDLLKNTSSTVKEVSHAVGFEDQLYFSRIFLKRIGISPSQYRKHMKK